MKLKEVFEKTTQYFKEKKIETARLDAEIILAHALEIERLQIYLKFDRPLNEAELQLCRDLVKRRSSGEPVAYIVGEKGFYGEIFFVGKGVLVPRPETELIVEKSLEFLKANGQPRPKILDIGAGTGCIGFSILKNHKEASLVSIEKSKEAFEFLKKNQNHHQLCDRSEVLLEDINNYNTKPKQFDLVVANPPYICKSDQLVEKSVREFEPESALFSEDGGFFHLFEWSKLIVPWLKADGKVFFEIGHLQGSKAKVFLESLNEFKDIYILKDLAGFDRVVTATKRG